MIVRNSRPAGELCCKFQACLGYRVDPVSKSKRKERKEGGEGRERMQGRKEERNEGTKEGNITR